MVNKVLIRDQHDQPVFFQACAAFSVTPSDTAELHPGTLYVGTGGDVKVTVHSGNDVIFANVPSGTFLPVVVIKVHNTSTSADDILLLR